MTGYLLDTNIPSEMTKARPASEVERWLEEVNDAQLFLSVISLAEILRGVHRLPDNRHRANLEQWLQGTLRPWFAGRVLPVTEKIAERAGAISGERDAAGLTIPLADCLIAATALEHGLRLVTRNVKDFADPGLMIVNPWKV